MSRELIILTGNYPPESGGPAKFASTFSHWASARGYKVKVVSTHPDKDLILEDAGVKVFLVSRLRSRLFRYILTCKILLAESNSNTLIISNGPLIEVLAASFFANRKYIIKIPGDIVWEQARASGHTKLGMSEFQVGINPIRYRLMRVLSNVALKRAKKVIVPSSIMYTYCLDWGIPKGKLVKVFNSVDTKLFRPNESTIEFDILTVSRLIRIKRIDQIIRASASLNKSLLIVGDGPLESELKNLAKDLKAPVTFIGAVEQSQLPALYNKSRLFVLNSEFEAGTPYSLLEARASGLICIANEETGSDDVITHGVDGILCGEKSGFTLTEALKLALARTSPRDSWGEMAVVDALNRFSYEASFERVLSTLEFNHE